MERGLSLGADSKQENEKHRNKQICNMCKRACRRLLFRQLHVAQILARRSSNSEVNTMLISTTRNSQWVIHFKFQTETRNVYSILDTLLSR